MSLSFSGIYPVRQRLRFYDSEQCLPYPQAGDQTLREEC